VYKYLKGECKGDGARLCSAVPSDRTSGSGHKLKRRRLSLNIRKHLLTVKVTEQAASKVVDSPSLQIFKSPAWTWSRATSSG